MKKNNKTLEQRTLDILIPVVGFKTLHILYDNFREAYKTKHSIPNYKEGNNWENIQQYFNKQHETFLRFSKLYCPSAREALNKIYKR